MTRFRTGSRKAPSLNHLSKMAADVKIFSFYVLLLVGLFVRGCTARKILHTELRNFNDAKAVCAQNGTTIATVLDGQQIEEAADAAQISDVWIGLVKTNSLAFNWVNPKAPVYNHDLYRNYWLSGYPNQADNCVVFYGVLKKFKTVPCSNHYAFICDTYGAPTSPPLTTAATVEEQKTFSESASDFFGDDRNIVIYIIIPLFLVCYGGSCVCFMVHKTRKYCRQKKRKRMLVQQNRFTPNLVVMRKPDQDQNVVSFPFPPPATKPKNAVHPYVRQQTGTFTDLQKQPPPPISPPPSVDKTNRPPSAQSTVNHRAVKVGVPEKMSLPGSMVIEDETPKKRPPSSTGSGPKDENQNSRPASVAPTKTKSPEPAPAKTPEQVPPEVPKKQPEEKINNNEKAKSPPPPPPSSDDPEKKFKDPSEMDFDKLMNKVRKRGYRPDAVVEADK